MDDFDFLTLKSIYFLKNFNGLIEWVFFLIQQVFPQGVTTKKFTFAFEEKNVLPKFILIILFYPLLTSPVWVNSPTRVALPCVAN